MSSSHSTADENAEECHDAAQQLSEWVASGGVLCLSAGAASRDEFNRPLDTFDSLLPADRDTLETLQSCLNSGSYVYVLQPQDRIVVDDVTMEVLSVRQRQTPREHSDVLAKFGDGSAAIVRKNAANGTIYSAGFLPALDYIKHAVVARRQLAAEQTDNDEAVANQTTVPTPTLDVSDKQSDTKPGAGGRLDRSYNPWDFSTAVRELILQPVRAAGVDPPLTCSVPLVDAVLLQAEDGAVIPIANYTLAPLDKVEFSLRSLRAIARIETIHQAAIAFESTENGIVRFSLPLDASEYISVYYR